MAKGGKTLTPRQQAVLDFIRDLIIQRGYGPTVREIGTNFDIRSPNGVVCHLKALEKKGLIRRDANKARAIELVDGIGSTMQDANTPAHFRLVGVVAAGFTKLSWEEDLETISFDERFASQDVFILRVDGDSMIEAHINDGDYVICRQAETASAGQIVVAMNDDDEVTLKYWFPEADRIRLQPANPAFDPIYVKNARIRGVVVGVFRDVG